MAVTISDVEALESKGWQHLPDDKKQDLLDDARAERNTLFSDKVSTLPTLDGDEDVFIKNLAAHKWELAEGGETQSESATGGSVSYSIVTSDPVGYLDETRFGRTAKQHLRNQQSISVITSY